MMASHTRYATNVVIETKSVKCRLGPRILVIDTSHLEQSQGHANRHRETSICDVAMR
jgi:hypothetical protein